MAIPVTGTEWKTSGAVDIDSRFLERGGNVAVFIRDYRGAATDISPASFSPFAQDGRIRDDLLAYKRTAGVWALNETANEGWWALGAFQEKKGPERRPNTKNDDFLVLQSNWPFDSDLTGEGEVVRLTPVETLKPLVKRIRYNLPITDSDGTPLVEDLGEDDFFVGKPVEADPVQRQLLLLRRRAQTGGEVLTAEPFPLVKLTDIGTSKKDKQDADAAELSFTVIPDPYFVDVDGTPIVTGVWIAGDAWTDMLVAS